MMTRRSFRAPIALATLVASVLAFSGCSANTVSSAEIVTSTTVWADIAQSIAGDKVTVTSILQNAAQDPHSYEATPKDQLLVSKANLVIAACNASDAFITNIASNSNLLCLADSQNDGANPHIWYDLKATLGFAARISQQLKSLYPAQANIFEVNYQTFSQGLQQVISSAIELPTKYPPAIQKSYIATETLANDLLNLMGFTDITPSDVVQAGLNETDLSPKQISELQKLLVGNLFVYNKSQESTQTDSLLAFLNDPTCQNSGTCLPKSKAIGFYEQLPASMHYLDWMQQNINDVVSIAGDVVID